MRKSTTAILALVLLVLAIWGSASAPKLSLLLTVDPIRVVDSGALKLRTEIFGSGALQAHHSELEVRNGAGKVVFSKKNAFIGDLKATAPSGGYGERAPASLSPGAYTAIWTVDNLKSNAASFTVGAGAPRALTLEQLENGHGACLLLHVVNTSSKPADFCEMVFGVNIIVDGKSYKAASGCGTGGNGGGLGPMEGFGMSLQADYQLGSMKGKHRVSAEYRKQRSNEVNADCQ